MPARSLVRHSLLALLLAFLAGAGSARAQGDGFIGGEDAFVVGENEGRQLGLEQGRVRGRGQALYESLLEGFKQGLAEAGSGDGAGRIREAHRLQGLRAGESEGQRAGREAGAQQALAGWLSDGRAPAATRPSAPPPPEREAAGGCPAAQPVRIGLVRELSIVVQPDGLEDADPPLETDRFEIDYPSEESLRSRARESGATAVAIHDWVRDYKFAFQSAWNQAYVNEITGTPLGQKQELRAVGLELGRKEGERRLGCEAGREAWRQGRAEGWKKAWESAFAEAFAETNDRHSKRAVVLVQDARLVEASGDGIFEPGESLRLEATLVNAGAVEAKRSAGSWGALRGIESEGHFEGGLAPGARRELRQELGAIDATAPPGTSLVLRLRGLGSQESTLSARLGRPARIAEAEGRFGLEGGRPVALVTATVESTSPESKRAKLELAAGPVTSAVGRLGEGERREAGLSLPAELPGAIGGAATGVFVLRTTEGMPWHAGRWSATLELSTAVSLAAREDAPPALAALLVEHLAGDWATALDEDRTAELPEQLRAYAAAVAGLPKKAQARLERGVTAPLLERIDDRAAPKRLRKQARELLDS